MTGWQPISTAPKDGTKVLIFIPGRPAGYRVNASSFTVSVHLRNGEEIYRSADWSGAFEERGEPTHWMPLPEEPA